MPSTLWRYNSWSNNLVNIINDKFFAIYYLILELNFKKKDIKLVFILLILVNWFVIILVSRFTIRIFRFLNTKNKLLLMSFCFNLQYLILALYIIILKIIS